VSDNKYYIVGERDARCPIDYDKKDKEFCVEISTMRGYKVLTQTGPGRDGLPSVLRVLSEATGQTVVFYHEQTQHANPGTEDEEVAAWWYRPQSGAHSHLTLAVLND
jgi:hypothetical protein